MLIKFYHIFADGIDAYADTGTEAVKEFMRMIDSGYERIRLYVIVGELGKCVNQEEKCLLGIGDMPY